MYLFICIGLINQFIISFLDTGSYSFVDPKNKVRTVQYIVDENGFQPSLINYEDVLKQPKDSEAVRREKERHRILYAKIAASNAYGIPAELPKVKNIVIFVFIIFEMYEIIRCIQLRGSFLVNY